MKINITNKLGTAINKGMIGLFFEDINYGKIISVGILVVLGLGEELCII